MATKEQLCIDAGSRVSIVKPHGEVHEASVIHIQDFSGEDWMTTDGYIFISPPQPDAEATWVFYSNSKTFRQNNGFAPVYPDGVIVEALPISFDRFVEVTSDTSVES